MKIVLKWLGGIIVIILLLGVAAVSYITLALPDVGKPENIKIEATPERIARGKYLSDHVVVCTDCHSKRDWSTFAAPVIKSSLGGGGEVFNKGVGFPGSVYVPNITPYNLKNWTDGELFRTITTGVKKDGTPIFPLMPWPYYSKMDREDVYSLIAYLRTLQPIQASYPKSKLDFPLNIIVHTMPQKATLGTRPNLSDTLKYGAYLVQIAACKECHSQDKQGKPIAGLEFAGGHEYQLPNGNLVRSANITPDKQTGIGNWTEQDFVKRFKSYSDPSKSAGVSKTDFQTIMPWYAYGGLNETDLKAIYTYLHSLKPVNNKVDKFTANSGALQK